ncbi:unnamed protein product [Linum tenue]|uniref:Uncharacterized protein n=1 Tax=Linum tenue TaxID=586396 RepID=A0AAV0MPQ2_9ROSI|nr:unnamed protein product [Linum tenue]
MADFHNDDPYCALDEETQLQKGDESDSDFEDDYESSKSQNDTTAVEFRNGKDMQGIPWERLSHTRDNYRETRLKQYKNYEDLSPSHEMIDKECLAVDKGKTFYDFQLNTRIVNSTIVHFQKRPGLLTQSLSRVQISSMVVKDNIMVAGGFQGELICKYLDHPGAAFCTKLTTHENAITNAVDIYCNPSGSMRIMAANNDAQIRVFDAECFACLSQFGFDWSVNSTSVSPDGKLVAVLGDSVDCLIADVQSGKVAANLEGHVDYSFSSAWHPDGRILATGNQDTTCRLWDIRNPSRSLAVLKGNMGAIRGLKFTSDGQFLGMQEAADFVHVFDVESGYVKCQEIDLFGEIAGISFSPDSESLFVGIADRTYGSLLEFNRKHYNPYLDSFY